MDSGRQQTSKERVGRIEGDYIRHPSPLRSLAQKASRGLCLILLVWLVGEAARSDHGLHSAGPLARPHRSIGNQCTTCHDKKWSTPSNRACSACHEASPHPGAAAAPVACTTCHRDHGGQDQLTRVPDVRCVTCHGNLATLVGTTSVTSTTAAFPESHEHWPERLPRARALRFSHERHMTAELGTIAGPVTLRCDDCHTFSVATGQFEEVRHQKHCARCHRLDFSSELSDLQVPHLRPGLVAVFMERAFREYARQHRAKVRDSAEQFRLDDAVPAKVGGTGPREAGRDGRGVPPQPEERWVQQSVLDSMDLLFDKPDRCAKCHVVTRNLIGELAIAPVGRPSGLLPAMRFRHEPHRFVDCASCHRSVTGPTASTVVAVPGLEVCAQCHSPAGGARSDCVECHGYHGLAGGRPWTGRHKLKIQAR